MAKSDKLDGVRPVHQSEIKHSSSAEADAARRLSGRSLSDQPKYNRPKQSRLIQQNLPVWEPILTLAWTIVFCSIISASCILLGTLIVVKSNSMTSIRVEYDGPQALARAQAFASNITEKDASIDKAQNCLLNTPEMANSFDGSHTCYITITLPQDIQAPLHVFYELENFYQHHRRLVSSVDRKQFAGESGYEVSDSNKTQIPLLATSPCEPMEEIMSLSCHVGECPPESYALRKLFPCGIVVNTMFNDIFWLHEGVVPNGDRLGRTDLVSKGVARVHPIHRTRNPSSNLSAELYLPVWHNPNMSRIIPSPFDPNITREPHITPDYTNSTAWVVDPLDPEHGDGVGLKNEHWRVWVDTAAMEPFRKPYAKIHRDLPAGTRLTFAVQSNFFVRSFEGSKSLVICEYGWFGDRNYALGGIFIAVGVTFAIAAAVFGIRRVRNPREQGDASALSWKYHKTKEE